MIIGLLGFRSAILSNLSLEFWQEIADAFVAERPDVTIELIEANAAVTPAADDFIKTRIAAGDVPDLMSNITINVFADAGLGDPPATWDGFAAACETLKAAGITPIITGGEWVAGYAFSIFTSAGVFHHNPRWYAVAVAVAEPARHIGEQVRIAATQVKPARL